MTINKRIKLYILSNITFEIKIIKKLYQLYYIFSNIYLRCTNSEKYIKTINKF